MIRLIAVRYTGIALYLFSVYMHNNSDEENDEENEIFVSEQYYKIRFLIHGNMFSYFPFVFIVQGENTHIYPNALSVYLLRAGKWKIPKTCIKKLFNHRSIEFIFEEVRIIRIFHRVISFRPRGDFKKKWGELFRSAIMLLFFRN